jgi:transposase InsO family protein
MSLQGSMTVERMCELARVSRASFYRSLKEQRPAEEATEVRSTIQQIALEHRRRYGYRRICVELRRRSMQVNHKRALRMMRRDNLLALRKRRFMVTTNSNHKFEVYLNLARRMKLSGMDQLWVRTRAKPKNPAFVNRVEQLATVRCNMLFKRGPCLRGFYEGFICGAVQSLVLLSR